MCTVTWLPLSDKHFILSSNRDEHLSRTASIPCMEYLGTSEVLFPKDPRSGGTWIAASSTRTVCLLNGAFEKHVPYPPYRKSRGLMLLDSFEYISIETFAAVYNFDRIEPFTLVVHEEDQLLEIRWDETKIHVKTLNLHEPHVWASATLYTEESIRKRNTWFGEWLMQTAEQNIASIMHFHEWTGDGNEQTDLVMKRKGDLQTISITSIERDLSGFTMVHKDLIQKSIHTEVCKSLMKL